MSPLRRAIGSSFIELSQVESTNNYATGLIHEGLAHHGTVVFAHHQTRGRGQRNKQWLSEKDESLTFTIIIEPQLSLSEAFFLSMAIAVASANVYAGHAGNSVTIKWPNDIYAGDRKAGGILIENIISGPNWKWSVAGIGLNINQENFGDLPAVSLKQITGKTFQPIDIANELCVEVESMLQNFSKENLYQQYQQRLYKKGEPMKFRHGSRVFEGIVQGVTTNGQLVVKHAIEEYFDVGEIEWLIH